MALTAPLSHKWFLKSRKQMRAKAPFKVHLGCLKSIYTHILLRSLLYELLINSTFCYPTLLVRWGKKTNQRSSVSCLKTAAPGKGLSHLPARAPNVAMWHLGTLGSGGLGSAEFLVGLDDFQGFSTLNDSVVLWFCYSRAERLGRLWKHLSKGRKGIKTTKPDGFGAPSPDSLPHFRDCPQQPLESKKLQMKCWIISAGHVSSTPEVTPGCPQPCPGPSRAQQTPRESDREKPGTKPWTNQVCHQSYFNFQVENGCFFRIQGGFNDVTQSILPAKLNPGATQSPLKGTRNPPRSSLLKTLKSTGFFRTHKMLKEN